MNNPHLDRACALLGSQDRLAAALKIKSPSISEWRKRGQVPPNRCVAIEELTGGAVTCHQLRPDLYPAPVTVTVAAPASLRMAG